MPLYNTATIVQPDINMEDRMTRYLLALFPALILALALSMTIAGCDGDGDSSTQDPDSDSNSPDSQAYTVAGTWTGSVSGYGHTVAIRMDLEQNGSNITGTFNLESDGESESGSVTGTYANGSGTLTFYSGGEAIIDGQFTFSGDSATGTFTYESYTLQINLTRS